MLICPAGVWLQTAGVHNLFCLYALIICDHCPPRPLISAPPHPRGMLRTLILCLQVPIVLNHHTVGKASWQNHDSLLLYYTAMVAYVYQTPTFPPHYGDKVKVKSQHICQAIPALLRGLGEAVVTNDWCIIYSP